MPHLTTEWSTDDPGIAENLRLIASLPEHSADRMELEGALHQWQAMWCMRRAGEIRGWKRAEDVRSGRARQSAAARKQKPLPGDEQ